MQHLKTLLEELEAIGVIHRELYNTAAREEMAKAIFDGFIAPKATFKLPAKFGLFSRKGNHLVKTAIAAYLDAVQARAAAIGLNNHQGRLTAFQNSQVRTDREKQDFADFFGIWSEREAGIYT